jgi:hypothetical protein
MLSWGMIRLSSPAAYVNPKSAEFLPPPHTVTKSLQAHTLGEGSSEPRLHNK